jgi:HPt (histidine-containing phosphotransfer) domain-containing protein
MLNETVFRTLGIDMEEGLTFCAEDPEFYEDMLREYILEGQSKQPELDASLAAEDLDNYRIQAHSLKNTSRMIGAEALSEQARELELLAKEGDLVAVQKKHGGFAAEYGRVLCGLEEMLD